MMRPWVSAVQVCALYQSMQIAAAECEPMRSLIRLAMAAWFVCACAGVGSAPSLDAVCAPYRVALEDMTRADQLLLAIQANDSAVIDTLGETVAQDGRTLQTLSASGGASDALSSVGAQLTTAALQAQDREVLGSDPGA